ncbi:MAG: two-component sensor histidine kinase [Chitinophagaceae bacterium]|nr:MAG: two-component sensor histidine kinase [Chitinophagaceae bacterium]
MDTTLHNPETWPAAWAAERAQLLAALERAQDELVYRSKEKDKRAAELELANLELAFQNRQREQRAEELLLANKNLIYQNKISERRAAELITAYQELDALHTEKEKRAAELVQANEVLAFESHEKEKRAAELRIANIELAYQNREKEKRASELAVANQELAFQNLEKEKRAAELALAVKELEAFAYISSHDLQEPLRKILLLVGQIEEDPERRASQKEAARFRKIATAAGWMRRLIEDLYAYSHLQTIERHFEAVPLQLLVNEVLLELGPEIKGKGAVIECAKLCTVPVIVAAFRQLLYSLLSNAIKFSEPSRTPRIVIAASLCDGAEAHSEKLEPGRLYCRLTVQDNGRGFDMQYRERIFTVFQRLHDSAEYPGTGIGLAVAKKVVELHGGIIRAEGKQGVGATFTVYIPVEQA